MSYFRKLGAFLTWVFFYTVTVKENRKFGWRHYKYITSGCLILFGVGWLFPAVCLNVWYLVTKYGCSSVEWRGRLGCICDSPSLDSPGQPMPWYVDLWDTQGDVTVDVRLSPQDKSLVIGYLPVCDVEQYLHVQLVKLNELPDDMKIEKLRQHLGKQPTCYILGA